MKQQTIIIVGAGISGLITALELADYYNIIVLEGADRTGGRLFSIKENKYSGIIEGGAEFIHGKLKHTINLLKEAGIDYVSVGGKMFRRKQHKWEEQKEIIEGWDELLHKMKNLETDMTVDEFLQHYFSGEEYEELRNRARDFAEGFDVADCEKASVQSLYREWSKESTKVFRIPAGYSSLIQFIENKCREKGCRIITGNAVKQIEWRAGSVVVSTINQEKWDAEKVVITIPVSILAKPSAKSAIHFTPLLDDYVKAAQQIGFGEVIKILIEFNESFWKKDTGFVLSDEVVPTWWTQLPNPIPLLTGWVGGTQARSFVNYTDEEILEKALLSLASIFDMPVQQIRDNMKASSVFNWQKNEYALGGYCYSMPASEAARKLLNTPVENTVYFTGEGLYDGKSPGTVEAAIIQAKKTANGILKKRQV